MHPIAQTLQMLLTHLKSLITRLLAEEGMVLLQPKHLMHPTAQTLQMLQTHLKSLTNPTPLRLGMLLRPKMQPRMPQSYLKMTSPTSSRLRLTKREPRSYKLINSKSRMPLTDTTSTQRLDTLSTDRLNPLSRARSSKSL